jgi:hypothetical protein
MLASTLGFLLDIFVYHTFSLFLKSVMKLRTWNQTRSAHAHVTYSYTHHMLMLHRYTALSRTAPKCWDMRAAACTIVTPRVPPDSLSVALMD